MDRFNYVKEDWYLSSKEEIKKSLQERHLTFEQAQAILEDLSSDLKKDAKIRLV
ncbi:hypothetical protein [Companilactobacillus nantensis]|uniref:Uncharacterized protein n=1 Tax=Companilactobacillus nantensis DSM 16982 TaxID=1423774 RepID=A0A0R1WEB5_9LACO|nr:hypothetical protein [Companilactobacillus nantensis]KRM15949.1 hypothetical protein FD31_GL000849 [Companilactobacillus nantensis DSM 16982]GEO64822.1 hypothetical protein LNA01_20050 [Companilactobacillus nantensis]